MSQIELIKNEIEKVKNKYIGNVLEIISDYKKENETKNDYKGRQLYELLQNADDSFIDDCNDIDVKIKLHGNKMIFKNTGKSFDARGIASLMHSNASSKYSDTIGYKGLGFRSVLNWAYDITICTKDFCVNFSEEKAIEKYNYYKNNSDKSYIEELDKIDRIAILCSATIIDNSQMECYLDDKYSTTIILCCNEKYIDSIQSQLKELQFEELLFLKHVRNISIETDTFTRNIESIKENDTHIINEENQCTKWKIWKKNGIIPQENGEEKNFELIIAYNMDPSYRENIRKNGVLYSFFKTEIRMPFPFLIHGTFDLTSERNSLIKENYNNKILIGHLIDFIIAKGTLIAEESESCDYEALKFLIPATDIYFLDKEYNFSKMLKEKIRNYNVFPTIGGIYISIDDNPKYSDREFCNILNPNSFSNLLKKCDDTKIRDFIVKDNCINFYENEEIIELINKDADEYVANGRNAKIIELYLDEYRNYKAAPAILSDNEGKRIIDNETKIFNNPESTFELPNWSKLRFINKNLEMELRDYWKCNAREMTDKLENFGCYEYSFDRILSVLINQCKEDKNRVISLLKWLFDNWKNNGQRFVSSLTNIDVKVISRDGIIVDCSKSYFGSEYNNKIGERIINNVSKNSFIADLDTLKFEKESLELVIIFFKQLGVMKYPPIESVELDCDKLLDYIKYNSKYFPVLSIEKNEQIKHSMFFSQNKKNVKVDAIKGLDKILDNADFNDILYWIFDDNNLYLHITSDREINDESYMKGYPQHKQAARYVRKSQMKSYLNKVFVEYEWLPTISNKKVSSYNCTLSYHKLSPVVEVLKIDYEFLDSLFKRNCKKDVEVLLEKLNIADDIEYLSKEKIYEIMLKLPELDFDYTLGKKIYTKLNLYYKEEKLDKLITDNKNYEKFKKSGMLLAEINKKYKYVMLKDVYYVGKKVYSDDILDSFPKLALNKRVGDSKVKKMFGVQPISKIINVEVSDVVEHELNLVYQKEYQKILPYIYAKRIDYDTKNAQLNILKKSKICLVSQASPIYYINGKEKKGLLKDYEIIYSSNEKIAYIKIPQYVQNINELKEKMKFISAVSEVITTMIDVDGDKDAFTIILRCQTTTEIEEYFKENGDETLSIVNLSKEKFGTIIDSKEEFWNAVSKAINKNIDESIKKEVYMYPIDYENLNSEHNARYFIEIFGKLNIDVDDYNKYAYEPIDLSNYYHTEFVEVKNKYRSKYLKYKLTTLKETYNLNNFFEEIKHNYDFYNISCSNSISFNVKKMFEEFVGIRLDYLATYDENFEELLNSLKLNVNEETNLENEGSYKLEHLNKKEQEIDYCHLNKEIANEKNDETIKANIIANPVNKKYQLEKEGKKGKTYSEVTQFTKDYNGFIAESKVYNILLKKIGMNGSVEWLSSNAEKAKIIISGDDSLGYDMKYSDSNGIHYVEVKGSSASNVEFTLTKKELDFAEENKEIYELWFVPIKNNKPLSPLELGNILKFADGENFLNNSRFSVEQSEFKVRAKIKEIEK